MLKNEISNVPREKKIEVYFEVIQLKTTLALSTVNTVSDRSCICIKQTKIYLTFRLFKFDFFYNFTS